MTAHETPGEQHRPKKPLDKSSASCYNNYRKREEDSDMTPDYWEIHADEWLEEQMLLATLA